MPVITKSTIDSAVKQWQEIKAADPNRSSSSLAKDISKTLGVSKTSIWRMAEKAGLIQRAPSPSPKTTVQTIRRTPPAERETKTQLARPRKAKKPSRPKRPRRKPASAPLDEIIPTLVPTRKLRADICTAITYLRRPGGLDRVERSLNSILDEIDKVDRA